MKKSITNLWVLSLFAVFAFSPQENSPNISINNQVSSYNHDDLSAGPGDCVIISTWKNCNHLCTGAICLQFRNQCAYKVKVTYRSKNTNGTWTSHELYLKAGEESQESMLCPYIEMKWEYVKVN